MTPTRTPTSSALGPRITYFGIANTDGCVACAVPLCNCFGTPSPTPLIESGRQVFVRPSGRFVIVIEARPGPSGTVGRNIQPSGPLTTPPDLQLESVNALGNGSAAVCDDMGPASSQGGIPAINPPDFSPTQNIINTLWDFSCRFLVYNPSTPCTLNGFGEAALANPSANPVVQFCDQVAQSAVFPPGDTLLTLRLADASGNQNIGPTAQIVVRVVTPTPIP